MKSLRTLLNDDCGFVISAELVIIATVVVLGMITGLKCIQVAVVGEMKDVAAAIGSLNQSYCYSGFSKRSTFCGCVKAYTRGSSFVDLKDECDAVPPCDLGIPCGPAAACVRNEVPTPSISCTCGALVDAAGQVVDLRNSVIDANRDCYDALGVLLGRLVIAIDEQGHPLDVIGTTIDSQGKVIATNEHAFAVLSLVIDACGNVIEFSDVGTDGFRGTLIGTLGVAIGDDGRTIDFRNTRINPQGIVRHLDGRVIGSLGSVTDLQGDALSTRGMLLTSGEDVIDLRGCSIDCHGTIFDPDGRHLGSIGIVIDSVGNIIGSSGIMIDPDNDNANSLNMTGSTHEFRGVLIDIDGTIGFSGTIVD